MLDHNLDRLTQNVQAIRATSALSASSTTFTNAILRTALGDLIRDTDASEDGLFTGNLKRVEFHGPSLPRKQDPEIYAEAALSYIERYNHIRQMPRARSRVLTILDQIDATRESIRDLTDSLEQVQLSDIKPLADKEQERIVLLQAKLADLKKKQVVPKRLPSPTTPVKTVSKPDDTFHTPAAAARTFRFTDNLLMDEQVDLADISVSSPAMPIRIYRPNDTSTPIEDSVVEEEQPTAILEEQDTITQETPAVPPSPTPSPVKPSPIETPKKGKVRVNSEVERVVTKIWATVGDLIMPGHSYDTTGTGEGRKPPHAKETIAHLNSLASLVPTPASPSTTISSLSTHTSTAPTPQQILTAHLLLHLLESGPQYSLPLTKVRELLADKASRSGGTGIVVGGQSTTRVLYACVAKRLVKIDRGGGEELVKFDL
ncbi:hypothetical protein MIND_00045200 [Mycena indigotica]|uniref:Uncharacterized protein n=1 Tax=Mycena indigotica TaxID=2126181 RepID=A0A8H6TEJ0_9AGAR|nr:uncharacterized protein MIND_00045200 [Mycena indigotica]KAF7315307.1 hypothetical protein MIND_00045200 [Mycena indigotica]